MRPRPLGAVRLSAKVRPLWMLGIGVAALAGAVMALIATRHGANLNPDATEYLSGARSLAASGSFRGVDGQPLSLFAPGLPTLLVPGVLAGLGDGGARWINAGLLGASAAGLGAFLFTRVRPVLAVVATVVTALGYPLFFTATWVWSEPLFIALSVTWFVLLASSSNTARIEVVALAAGLVNGAAILTRYAGITLLPVGVGVLLLLPQCGRLRRARTAALYGLVAGVTTAPWLVRNLASTGYPTGERFPSSYGLATSTQAALDALWFWVVPAPAPPAVRLVVLLAGIGVVAAVVLRLRRGGRSTAGCPRGQTGAIAGAYLVTSLLLMIVLATQNNTNALNDRLLGPLVVPLVVVLVVTVDWCLDVSSRLVVAAVLPLIAVGVSLTARTVDAVVENRLVDQGYLAPAWKGSDLRRLVIDGSPLISNQPWGVYAATGRQAAESPRATGYNSTFVPVSDLAHLRNQVAASGPVHLVWVVQDLVRSTEIHLTPEQLVRDGFGVRELDRTQVGAVYEITASP